MECYVVGNIVLKYFIDITLKKMQVMKDNGSVYGIWYKELNYDTKCLLLKNLTKVNLRRQTRMICKVMGLKFIR
jgi:hypothetical protein